MRYTIRQVTVRTNDLRVRTINFYDLRLSRRQIHAPPLTYILLQRPHLLQAPAGDENNDLLPGRHVGLLWRRLASPDNLQAFDQGLPPGRHIIGPEETRNQQYAEDHSDVADIRCTPRSLNTPEQRGTLLDPLDRGSWRTSELAELAGAITKRKDRRANYPATRLSSRTENPSAVEIVSRRRLGGNSTAGAVFTT
ncbi:unnamed protein product [Nezara viridula]|uniref:Uncharacterized protein n=1 Tax=Nezara viridula TaxID=85310 RepID=A0A9P0HFE3_NEZVI|nr:unnamed protein product [Nezara viridula]